MIRRLAITAVTILATLLAWLAPGCADLNSMPTRPESATTSSWTETYGSFYLDDLRAVWAMDVDDAWFGGYSSALLHWNGAKLERHEIESGDATWDIDGCASDEVWRVGSTVHRWDGQQWTRLVDPSADYAFYTVLCEAPDRVFVGGETNPYFQGRHGVVRRYTGHGWKDHVLPGERSRVFDLWRPHADGPLYVAVSDSVEHVYTLDDGRWNLLDWPEGFIDADGDLVTFYTGEPDSPVALYRIEPDHTLTLVCAAFAGEQVLQSRGILACYDRGMQLLVGCTRRTVLGALPDDILEYAVPERPGAASPAIFGVGEYGRVVICGWQPDWTMTWRSISPVDSYRIYQPLVGNDHAVFAPAWGPGTWGVLAVDAQGWRMEELGFTPEGLRFLGNGDLLAWNYGSAYGVYGSVARRDDSGIWHELPPTNAYTIGIWGNDETDLVAMSSDGRFSELVGGQWRIRDELGGHCQWFAGFAADRIYAVIDIPRLGRYQLLAYDGHVWRNLTPEQTTYIDGVYLGPHTGTLYARFATGADWVTSRLVDGQWQVVPNDEYESGVRSLREGSDGALYRRRGRIISRLTASGWKPFYETENSVSDFTVDPVNGVHVADNGNRILHHPYRPR